MLCWHPLTAPTRRTTIRRLNMLEAVVSVKYTGADGAELSPAREHVWSDLSMKEVNKMEKGLIDILKKLNTISTERADAGSKAEVGGKKSSYKGAVDFELTFTKDGALFSWSAFKWPNIGNKEFEFMEGMLDGEFGKHTGKLKKNRKK
jgi:hypothetical protein